MIKVLHTLESYLPVTQNWIYPQIAGLRDVETSVLCRGFTNSKEFPPVGRKFFCDTPYSQSSWLPRRILYAGLRRARVCKLLAYGRVALWNPVLLHAHFGTHGWESLWLKKALRVPLITTFYGAEAWELPVTTPIWCSRYTKLFREGDLFLVEGPAMRQRLIDLGCPPERIQLRRLGVDLSKITFATPDFSAGLKIAMVGRFVEKKGLVDGLNACREVVGRGVPLSVTIIGDALADDVGQGIKKDLLALAQSSELAGRVRFTGFLSHAETQAALKGHNVLLCPSRHAAKGDAEGGMPFVLAEAMALGIVGVGSRHCDMQELIIDGVTGYSFAERNIRELVELLCSLAYNSGPLSRVALSGRRHIESKFDLSRQLNELRDIYAASIH
jgi:colanic acid/amylovoran biosynthesis glycosyltransferase